MLILGIQWLFGYIANVFSTPQFGSSMICIQNGPIITIELTFIFLTMTHGTGTRTSTMFLTFMESFKQQTTAIMYFTTITIISIQTATGFGLTTISTTMITP